MSIARALAARLLRYLIAARSQAESNGGLISGLASDLSAMLSPEMVLKLKDEIRATAMLDYPGATISLDPRSASELVRASAAKKEPWTVSWIEALRPGDVLFDLGANVGAYALIAAKQPARIHVFAFEPSFENYAALCRNIARNGCGDVVTALPIAVAAQTGIETFNYHALDPGSALHVLGASVDYRGQAFEPKLKQQLVAMSLDDAISVLQLPVPTHIKVDVDGTEMDVLRGASLTLCDGRLRSLLIEICEYRVPSKEIVAFLQRHGFAFVERHDRPSPPGELPEVSYLRFERS
jgi:FkbM family methyltransferase